MQFSELQTELYARGFDYLNDGGAGVTRAKQWLNDAYQEICELAAWPFVEASSSGAAPLTVSDLRTVLTVTDSTNKRVLQGIDRRSLVELNPDLTVTGNPEWFYLEDTVVKVFPANTSVTVAVRYLKVPTALSANGDTPLVPSRYHNLIVDLAVVRAYLDKDNFEAAATLRAEVDRKVADMAKTLLNRNYGGVDYIVTTGWWSE